jgi:hypothetical protein
MKVQQNVGSIDRIARIAIGIALAAVALSGAVAGPAVYVAWFVAGLMLVTGAVGFCPLYAALGVSTAGNRLVIGRHSKA